MTKVIRLNRGLDIRLVGSATLEARLSGIMNFVAITPDDFHGLVPKVLVKAGDAVKAGTPIVCDKVFPEVILVSPVSGIVETIVRGEKRKLIHILIRPDGYNDRITFPVENPLTLDSVQIRLRICTAGLWPYIKQRPYDVFARPQSIPRDIFVTGFDTAPLAADSNFLLKGQGADFQTGLDALTRLTNGQVYLSIPENNACAELKNARNVVINRFSGPHPTGNVGVQINHIKPINKGEVAWTLSVQEVLYIGRLFNKGQVDLTRLVAVCGPGVRKPCYIKSLPGAPIASLLAGNIYQEMHARIISGNPLTGTIAHEEGYLHSNASSITVLKEGDDTHEFFGWIMPRIDKFSMSKTYLSGLTRKLFPSQKYEPDTRVLGGERALIVSGEYDQVFPMDILPEHLVRACITGNIEKQEMLGIYEVAPEDFALCEYVCTSKVEVQKHVRKALDTLRIENGD